MVTAAISGVLRLVGAIFIYISLFLYESEERSIQNRIEEWWIKLDYKRATSRSRVATFMQEVARLTGKGLDRLFGARLLSLRTLAISIYLSFASFFLLVLIIFPTIRNPGAATRHGAFLGLLLFLALALVPACSKDWVVRILWWSVIPVTLISISGFIIFVFKRQGAASTLRGIAFALLPFAVSFLWDFLYIALIRWILRYVSAIDRIPVIALMLVGSLALAVMPFLGTIYVGLLVSKYAQHAGAFIVVSILFNFIDVLFGCAALLLALFLLIHRVFWPVIQRPLYAVQRFTPIKSRKWLFGAGLALISIPYHITFRAFVFVGKKILSL